MSRFKSTWHPPKKRSERILVVLVPAAIAAGSAFGVWLLRPGGYSARQPRISWLICFGIIGVILVMSLLRNIRTFRSRPILRITIAVIATLIGCGIAAHFWPGKLVKKYPKIPKAPSTQLPPDATATVPAPTSATNLPQASVSETPTSTP